MAWRRDDTNLGISGSTAYSYTRVDWSVGPTSCSYRHIGGVTSPYYFSATATSTLQWWENGTWHDYESGSHYFGGYEDQPICDVRDSFVRTASDRSVSLGCYTTMMGGAARAWLDYTVPHLPDIIPSLTATKVSDNQMNLEWTLPSTAIDGVEVAVFVDNGSRSTVAILNGSPTSYQYTGASAGHLYGFSVRARYQGAWCSTWTGTGYAIATTPVPPESITASAVGGTAVDITLTNPTFLATSVEYEVSTDGGETWGATQESASTTSFQTNISGSGKVRVRNVYENQNQGVPRITGTEWLVSGDIVTICPPAAPTLISPSGNVVDMASGSVTFSWLHNSLDGSSQTAAQLAYSTNGGSTWTTVTKSTEQSHTISPIPWAAGTAVTWRVRTKGADANYGDWAQAKTFNVYTAPTLSITLPGATITGMPISLAATYSDMAGFTCQAATVSLQKDGRTLYSEAATINGSSITASLDVSEFLPTNGETYTVVLTARSSSGLSTSANATFTVDFVEPQAGELSITNDPETGYASLLATFDNSASDVEYSGETNEQYDSAEGYVRSLTVEGKSAKWNQLRISYYAPQTVSTNVAIAESGGGITLSGTAAANAWPRLNNYDSNAHLVSGRVYALVMDTSGGSSQIEPYIDASQFGTRLEVNHIGTCTGTGIISIQTRLGSGTAYSGSIVYKIGFYDLTAIFGSGNEPATVEEFKATDVYKAKLAAGELYDYDAGSLVSIGSVVVRGRNLIPSESGWEQGTLDESKATGSSYNDIKLYRTHRIRTTDPVPVEPSTTYTVKLDTNYQLFYCCFGSSGYLGVYNGWLTNNTGTFSFTTDANTTAVGLCIRHLDNSNITPSEVPTMNMSMFKMLTTITTTLSSVGSVHDQLQADADSWTVERKVGTRAYQAGDESDPDVLTDGTNTYYALTTPTTDTPTSMSTIEIGSAFTVATDLDSTFSMTTWDGSVEAVSISVSRVNADGTVTPLLTDGQSGAGIVDKYAPLNTDYQYAITTKAVSQAVKTVYVTNRIDSLYWFAYWGENIAKAKWNPDNGGIQVTRPQKTRVYYAGRRDPVSYDGHAVALTETPSWMFIEQDEIKPFVQLIEDGGRGVYKSCDGWVYHADFDLTMTPSYTAIGYYGGASLGITRIAGDKL